MNRILTIFLWIPAAITALSISMVMLVVVSKSTAQPVVTLAQEPIIPAAKVLGSYHSNVISEDARPQIVARFLKTYQCPLEPYNLYAKAFVDTADRHSLDFRLLPAISMQESNCCKKMPDGTNNCWGYGIYGDKMVHFESIEQGMEVVAQTLARNYTAEGLMEPDEIMNKYTPSNKGTWAYGVLYFMNEMK